MLLTCLQVESQNSKRQHLADSSTAEEVVPMLIHLQSRFSQMVEKRHGVSPVDFEEDNRLPCRKTAIRQSSLNHVENV